MLIINFDIKLKKMSSESLQSFRKEDKSLVNNTDHIHLKQGLEILHEKINDDIFSKIPDEELFSVDFKGYISANGERESAKCLENDENLSYKSSISFLSNFSEKDVKNVTNKSKSKKQIWRNMLNSKEICLGKINRKFNYNLLNNINFSGQISSNDSKLYDIWKKDNNSQKLSLASSSLGQKFPKMPSTLQHKSLFISNNIPNVEVANAGMSYNPLFEEYKKLINEESAKELLREIKNDQERRKKSFNVSKQDSIKDKDPESLSEDNSSTEDINHCLISKKSLKKTRKQRKKEMRKKREIFEYNEKRRQKMQIRDLNSINKIIKLIEEKAYSQKLANISNPIREATSRRKLRRHSAVVRPLEIQLSDELSDSFRLFKPEGNIFIDRFISLQERGLIETRCPVISYRKYPRRYVEKWSYKKFKL
ncbi:hypothetical protein T552_01709 [Pneumocystis carinii B80]|uniref:Ribosome biogenesis protein NOP53 n=1 Tax=Pneumocystis carinii (strain B80) TaxID=1408658 RepID=A0A0W4ZJA8_PNEC8|nr:hypothetical protein T552_01709 [Pneumocystis carinii B80]KTW28447.1 hypothetical protein T552_01709 [Pneumocystis carinii B80]